MLQQKWDSVFRNELDITYLNYILISKNTHAQHACKHAHSSEISGEDGRVLSAALIREGTIILRYTFLVVLS